MDLYGQYTTISKIFEFLSTQMKGSGMIFTTMSYMKFTKATRNRMQYTHCPISDYHEGPKNGLSMVDQIFLVKPLDSLDEVDEVFVV